MAPAFSSDHRALQQVAGSRLAATLVALLLAVTVAAPHAQARELRAPIPLVPPWGYYDTGCHATGIVVDLLREIAKRAGHELRFVQMGQTVEEQVAGFEAGKLDIDITPALPWYDAHLVRMPLRIPVRVIAVYRGAPPSSAQTAGSARPSLASGETARRLLAQRGVNAQVNSSYEELARLFMHGETDFVAGIHEALVFHLLRAGVDASEVLRNQEALGTVDAWLYLSPATEAETGASFRKAMQGLEVERILARLRREHLQLQTVSAFPDQARCRAQDAAALP